MIYKLLTNLSVIKPIIQGKNRNINNDKKYIMNWTEIRSKNKIKQIWVQYVDQNTQTRNF